MGNPAPHRARKRFGQHFLHDRNIIHKLIQAIHPQQGDRLLEIGPGQGALTFPLLEKCKELTAIELDRDLIPLLQQKAEGKGKLHLINQDVLTINLSELELNPPLRMVGNLPYNISTPLMFHLLTHQGMIQDMHFMVQKEVALRIIARANDKQGNSKHYGRLSVMMQYYCQCEFLFNVPPGCFSPPPKVDSAIIRLIPHENPPVRINDMPIFADVVQTAFNQRRKTIANSLKKLVDSSKIKDLGIDPKLRAENLELTDFAALANAIQQD